MATFAPPVRRGDFLYTSILYADAGNGNHHPRASTADLAALLRPEAPKLYSKGRKPVAATPAKDQVWHWYAAQLIHYGLPVTKDKNTAKVRLLDAMNQFKLEVPGWISKAEGEMKKEWEAENRKLKKGSGSTKAKKGKAGDIGGSGGVNGGSTQVSSGAINVNVNFSMGPVLEQLGMGKVVSTLQKGKRKRGEDQSVDDKPAPKKAASAKKTTTLTAQTKKTTASVVVSVPPAAKIKSATPKVATKPAPKKPRVKKENSPESPPYASSSIKRETQTSAYNPPPRGRSIKQEHPLPSTIRLSGTYTITTLSIFATAHLDFYKDPHRPLWWARAILTPEWTDERYDFIIKMDPGPSASALGRPVTLGWRMRTMYAEEVKFGTGCTGEATFYWESDEASVRMVLRNVPVLGDIEMRGVQDSGPGLAEDLQEDWEDFRRG